MGFLDKLKSVANAITGGGADVSLESEALTFGRPFSIKVSATVGENDVDAAGVYLKIEGYEEISIPDREVIYPTDNADPNRHRERIRAQGRTFQAEYVAGEAAILKAGNSYDWTVEVTMPEGAPGSFEGLFCRHTVRAKAGIDCSGNDPDSGWIDLKE
jgi:hypothetical protein